MKPIYWITLLVIVATLFSTLFIVEQTEQVLVLQFGEAKRVIKEPGLHYKIPFVQNVARFDRRIIDLNADPEEVIASDQKRLIVDAFAKYRIINPLQFYQTVRTEAKMQERLNAILQARLRGVLGSHPLSALLTDQRVKIMATIRDNITKEAAAFGIEVVDVRIMRADLPSNNSQAIFLRMQTERAREAKEFRAKGAEEGQRITARADRDKAVLLAEARKKSEILRGEGDGDATRIFAEAFGRDPAFFDFYRTMQAYRATLNKENTRMVLSPDSGFLRHFTSEGGEGN